MEPGSRLRRAITIRNVALAVLGASVLVFKSAYNGPFEDALNAYAGAAGVGLAVIVDLGTSRALRRRYEPGER